MHTILVVDDNSEFRQVLCLLFEARGLRAVGASDGVQAIETIRQNDEIEGAIVDLNMPNMGGVEAITEMLNIRPSMKAWIATGLDDNEKLSQEFRARLEGVITKPFDTGSVAEQMLAAFEQQPHSTPQAGSGVL